jgi:CYTH domain-containing protein
MGIEIERRFLVRDPDAATCCGGAPSIHIIQGYFGIVDRLRVRVRIMSDSSKGCAAFLTFKGARKGLRRLEFEYPVEIGRARQALDALPSSQIIRKRRYETTGGDGMAWTVDLFEGLNKGLALAEIELAHPNQKFQSPLWLGEEVTFDPRYGNSRLAWAPRPRELEAA